MQCPRGYFRIYHEGNGKKVFIVRFFISLNSFGETTIANLSFKFNKVHVDLNIQNVLLFCLQAKKKKNHTAVFRENVSWWMLFRTRFKVGSDGYILESSQCQRLQRNSKNSVALLF